MSLDFRRTKNSGNTEGLRVGFTTGASGTTAQVMGAYIKPRTDGFNIRAQLGGGFTNGPAVADDKFADWFRVVATITHTLDNAGEVKVDLYRLDGVGAATFLDTWTINAVDANFADTTLHAGFYNNSMNAVGFRDIDNFSVSAVPEPASLGLVGLGVVGRLRGRRA